MSKTSERITIVLIIFSLFLLIVGIVDTHKDGIVGALLFLVLLTSVMAIAEDRKKTRFVVCGILILLLFGSQLIKVDRGKHQYTAHYNRLSETISVQQTCYALRIPALHKLVECDSFRLDAFWQVKDGKVVATQFQSPSIGPPYEMVEIKVIVHCTSIQDLYRFYRSYNSYIELTKKDFFDRFEKRIAPYTDEEINQCLDEILPYYTDAHYEIKRARVKKLAIRGLF
ncbi:MAG: hypothetical protein V1838_02165 [Patescibacteria group bacterium]